MVKSALTALKKRGNAQITMLTQFISLSLRKTVVNAYIPFYYENL